MLFAAGFASTLESKRNGVTILQPGRRCDIDLSAGRQLLSISVAFNVLAYVLVQEKQIRLWRFVTPCSVFNQVRLWPSDS